LWHISTTKLLPDLHEIRLYRSSNRAFLIYSPVRVRPGRLSTHEAINAAFDRALANASCVPGLKARFNRAVVRETSSRALVETFSQIARLHMYAALPFLYFTKTRSNAALMALLYTGEGPVPRVP
jgi:hypothetical protein